MITFLRAEYPQALPRRCTRIVEGDGAGMVAGARARRDARVGEVMS